MMRPLAKKAGALTRAAVLGALAAGGMAGLTSPASAQFFGGGGGGLWGGPVYRQAVIPPRFVAAILRGQGFQLADMPVRRGPNIIALGTDGRGQVARFVLDAYDGEVIRMAFVGATRPPGYAGRSNGYAYGGPGAQDFAPPPAPRLDAPLDRPRAKPRVRTATKTPAPLPHAAPASPAPAPSIATRPPETPVKPLAATPVDKTLLDRTPVATTPPLDKTSADKTPANKTPDNKTPAATASVPVAPVAPQTSIAPDAQPKDIGPKVVPVKPAEARGPDTPPPAADWDTEAPAKTVTPEEANKMAPERHPDQ